MSCQNDEQLSEEDRTQIKCRIHVCRGNGEKEGCPGWVDDPDDSRDAGTSGDATPSSDTADTTQAGG